MKRYIVLILMFFLANAHSQDGGLGKENIQLQPAESLSGTGMQAQEQMVKESELVDFNSIKDILKNDKLEKEASKVEKTVKSEKRQKIEKKHNLHNIPGIDEFWSFFSEYWLVKNAPVLKWDYQHPEYGLEETLEQLLEKFGLYEKRFKILLVNTTTVYHIALPSDQSGTILLLSDPFIKHLDLSKVEISLLLLQDFLRERLGQFKRKAETKELKSELGTNFESRTLNSKIFDTILKNYDQIIFNKGFTFQEQFDLTKEMSNFLKSESALWTTYINLIKKLDGLVKTENKFQDYIKIYPSPELQLGWMGVKIEKQ